MEEIRIEVLFGIVQKMLVYSADTRHICMDLKLNNMDIEYPICLKLQVLFLFHSKVRSLLPIVIQGIKRLFLHVRNFWGLLFAGNKYKHQDRMSTKKTET